MSGVVEKASHQRLDRSLREKLFAPLGIRDITWSLDDAGTPSAFAGLHIHPLDFAKIGQLVLQGGVWHGHQLIDPAFIAESTRPSQRFNPTCGLLWWLAYETVTDTLPAEAEAALRERGVPSQSIEVLRDALGQPVSSLEYTRLVAKLSPAESAQVFNALNAAKLEVHQEALGYYGFYANGYLGQFVLVVPGSQLVVVRMADSANAEKAGTLTAPAFLELAHALAR